MFIAIDGIDCCGKDTQEQLLAQKLKPNLIVRCPNRNTQIGTIIEGFLIGTIKLPMMAQVALFEANRWFHSGMAYAMASSHEYLEAVEALIRGLPIPDISIIIDISVAESIRRKNLRNRFEIDVEFLERVRESFLDLAKKYKWHVVNGEKEPDEVFTQIWDIIV